MEYDDIDELTERMEDNGYLREYDLDDDTIRFLRPKDKRKFGLYEEFCNWDDVDQFIFENFESDGDFDED